MFFVQSAALVLHEIVGAFDGVLRLGVVSWGLLDASGRGALLYVWVC